MKKSFNKDLIKHFFDGVSRYYFVFALLFVMGVYLPVNYLEFLNFDDTVVLERAYKNFSDINWYGLFFRSSDTVYYRPLLEVLCYMDYALWGLSLTAYHLTNYSIHILNSVLVYLIALQWFQSGKKANGWAALAMVFFALNPMTCESVAWISGRSDLAGTFFSLLAVRCYFLKSSYRFALTPLAILLGLLCKENALAVIPIIVLIEGFINYKNKKQLGENIKACLVWSIIVLIPLLIYLFLRTNGWENYTYEFFHLKTGMSTEKLVSTQQVSDKIAWTEIASLFPVIAFYLKKLVMPFPLNFAIVQINTAFYTFLSAILLGTFIFWCWQRKVQYLFFVCLLVVSFIPALPVALGNVSWVPLAERYLYMSVCIMAIGAAYFLMVCIEKKGFNRTVIITICFLMVLILAVSTLQREFVFKNSKTIWTATLKTNPTNSMVLFKYGQAVGGKEGQHAFKKAVSNPKPFVWRAKTLLSIAQYESSNGNHEEAVVYIKKAFEIENSPENYLYAAFILLKINDEDISIKEKYIIMAIDCYQMAYRQKKTVFVLYQIATLSKHIKNFKQANELFRKIVKEYPQSKYAVYAKKQLSTPDKKLL